MKIKNLAFLVFIGVLTYLAFVKNISINIGDEVTIIGQDEWYEANHPNINNNYDSQSNEGSVQVDFGDFNLFLSEIQNRKFYRHDISYLDTTGDGQLEKVNSIISITSLGCKVSNYIEKNEVVIWKDEFLISKEVAWAYVGSEDFIKNYGNYALYYLGQVASHFVEKLDKNQLFDQRKKQLLRNSAGNLSLRQLYASPMSKSMEDYTGMYLFRLYDGLGQIFMWDNESSKFVCVHKNKLAFS